MSQYPPEISTPPASSDIEEEEKGDPKERAERIKEKGNVAFKAGKYQEAIEHYTKAIGWSYLLSFCHSSNFFP